MRTLGAMYVGIAALYLLLPLDGSAQVWFGVLWLTALPTAALGTTLLARSRASQGARLSWLLLALACVAGLTGQLLWNVEEVIRQRPVSFPSPSYFLFMLFHPLLVAGILTSLRAGSTRRTRLELALDGAVAWSVITVVLLRLLFEPLRAVAPHLTFSDQFYIVAGQVAVQGALVGAGVMLVWRDSVLPPRTVAALLGVTVANSTANLLSLARLDPDPGSCR